MLAARKSDLCYEIRTSGAEAAARGGWQSFGMRQRWTDEWAVLLDCTGRMISYSKHGRAERIRKMDISVRGSIMRASGGGANIESILFFHFTICFTTCFNTHVSRAGFGGA